MSGHTKIRELEYRNEEEVYVYIEVGPDMLCYLVQFSLPLENQLHDLRNRVPVNDYVMARVGSGRILAGSALLGFD